MIVVTTPTGHIGSHVARKLLNLGEKVRVLVRDPARLPAAVRERVAVVQGSLDDRFAVEEALEGAEALFHCVPPSFTTSDVRAHYLAFTDPACRAIATNQVQRVVSVSGIGRKVNVPAGVVTAAFAKDEAIEATGVNFRALWCPGFFENMMMQVGNLKAQGVFFDPAPAAVKRPYVATRDIASTAVKLLTDRTWSGQGGVAVLGPEDLSPDDMAAILTEVLGRPIRFQQVPYEAYEQTLRQHGASQHFAESLVEMQKAKEDGLDLSELRTAENTTPTSFREWAQEILRPALRA